MMNKLKAVSVKCLNPVTLYKAVTVEQVRLIVVVVGFFILAPAVIYNLIWVSQMDAQDWEALRYPVARFSQ